MEYEDMFFSQLYNWVKNAANVKHDCSIYYNNEKIFSCKDYNTAEKHIKRIYGSLSSKSLNIDEYKNAIMSTPEKSSCWKNFRNNFKIRVE